jgi:hypothetical protein
MIAHVAPPPLDLKADLIARADAYCEATGRSKARLATIVANDGKFFDRIASGGGMTTRMYERFLAYFATNPAPEKSNQTQAAGAHP